MLTAAAFSRRMLLATAAALAATVPTFPARAADATINNFEAREQKDDRGGTPLPYRLFKPVNYDATRKYPVTRMRWLRSHSASEVSSIGELDAIPALETTMSTPPKRSTAAA